MKHIAWKRAAALFVGLALCVTLVTPPAMAAAPTAETPFVNLSQDGGENVINLTQARSFKAAVPVDMTEAEAQAAAPYVVWSLDYDAGAGYLDPELFPNHTQGGALDSWEAMDGSPLFSQPVTGVEVVDGKVCLTVTFDSSIYFYGTNWRDGAMYADPSAPHSEGGSYMDVCGWYDLTAAVDGEALGSVPVKVTPYDAFHTMKEVYAAIDALVDYAGANTGLYVQRFSMGMTQGDNGLESLDMPYLIIAKSRAAVDKWLTIKAKAESDPTALIQELESGALTDYQVPILYSNVHTNEVSATDGILKFAQMLVEAAAGTGRIDYNKLTGFTEAGQAELARQMGPVGEAGSVAVPDLVKDTATYLGYIKAPGSGKSAPVDLEKYYTQETVTVDVDALLDDVFFLIVPAENAEGRTYITRESSGGVDLNRDNSFQTQAETRNMTKLIADWNPVSFTEFHGRVQAFQCEPCDPPHEPNFEYDLLAEHLVSGGEAFGIAAVANNDSYNSYVIPQRDYLSYNGQKTADGQDQTQWFDPWDDMSTSYTPQYAMLHGTVAYTVEQPAYNDQTAAAIAYGQLGQSDYIAANKQSYLLAQTRIFERGVTNFNSDAYELVGQWFCDQYDVEGAEMDVFRPEYDGQGQNGNFYPECYIIPLDSAHQKNLDAADQMVAYLIRNGVQVMFAEKSFSYDGAEYPAGTAVVSMYQAKRGVANGVLYDGTVITGWPVLYSEGITAFNMTRGFDMAVCAEPEAYQTIAAVCAQGETWTVRSDKVDTDQVILRSTSEAAVIAVNRLLKAGKSVGLITEGDYTGNFLLSGADYESVSGDLLLNAAPVETAPAARTLTKAPVIYIAGRTPDDAHGFVHASLINWGNTSYNFDRQSMALMGFETTEDVSEADLIIGAAMLDDEALAAVKAGTPYIGYGEEAMWGIEGQLFGQEELVRESVDPSAMDALGYVTYPTRSLITASYVSEGDDIMYGYGAGYFSAIPDGAKVLVRMDGSRELMEGFLPITGEHYEDFLNDSIQAISYNENGMDVVLFANTLTNKMHQRDEFTFVANAAFLAVSGGFDDVAFDSWYFSAVEAASAAGLMGGTGENVFTPDGTVTRETVATVLYRAAGSPTAEGDLSAFSDSGDVSGWAQDAVRWAVQAGVLTGSDGAIRPAAPITREQLAVMLWRFAESQGVDVSVGEDTNILSYADVSQVSEYAVPALQWAVGAGVLGGMDGDLAPAATATRAQLAAMLLRLEAAM